MVLEVIDFQSSAKAKRFTESLKQTGFAVLKNHAIDNALVEALYSQWLAFLNTGEKYQYEFNQQTQGGFYSTSLSETAKGHSVKDLKEFFHFYKNGICPPSLLAITDELFDQMNQFAIELLGFIEAALPDTVKAQLSMPLSEMIVDSEDTLLRIIHYPPLDGPIPAGAVRAAAHEDINLITLLPAATAKGLQVKTKQNQWIDVPCDSGWLIINIGDMLQECCDGFYRSTSHRVINPCEQTSELPRVSSPLFLHPRGDVVLSDRHTAKSYREERFRELGHLK